MSQEVVSLTKAKQNLGTVGWRERLALTEESAASAPGRPGRTPPPPLLVLGAESQARGATPPGLPAQTDSDERRAHTEIPKHILSQMKQLVLFKISAVTHSEEFSSAKMRKEKNLKRS